MARPIFVLGLQRSGTTWIGNLLAAHPAVAAVTAIRHGGIHESLFFSHFARAWDWDDRVGRTTAIQAFLDSDYCTLMELTDKDRKAILSTRTAAQAFCRAMDILADRQSAEAWVEKSPHHTRHAHEIAQGIPDAVFVAIHRKTPSLIGSRLGAYGRTPPHGLRRWIAVLRATASNAFHRSEVRALARRCRGRVIEIDFDTLKADTDTVMAGVLSALRLTAVDGLRSRHHANATPKAVRKITAQDRRIIAVADRLFALAPRPFLALLRRLVVRETVRFPGWVWRNDNITPETFMVDALSREERKV